MQSFSADLDSMFGLASGENVGQLEQTVEQKYALTPPNDTRHELKYVGSKQ